MIAMVNQVFIYVTVLSWVVVGVLIPVVTYVFRKLDVRLENIENKLKEGGFMTFKEHSGICEKSSKESSDFFCRKIDEMFKLHKDWLEERLKRLESDVKLYVQNKFNEE